MGLDKTDIHRPPDAAPGQLGYEKHASCACCLFWVLPAHNTKAAAAICPVLPVPHATRHKASGRHLHVEAPHAGHGHHSLLNHHMMHHSAQCNPQNTSRTRHPSQLGAAVSRRGPISARHDTSGTAGSLAPTSHSPRSLALEIGAAHMHTSIMPQHASADSPDRPLGGLQCPLIGMRSGSSRHKWTALTTSCLNQPVFVAERARGVVLSDINAPIRARGPHGAIALCAWVCMEVAV